MKSAGKLLLLLRQASGIVYLLRDEFTTALSAGSVDETSAEPGPGKRNVVADTGNDISITSDKLVVTEPGGSWTAAIMQWTKADGSGWDRAAGLCLRVTVNHNADATKYMIGWDDTDTATYPRDHAVYIPGNRDITFDDAQVAGSGLGLVTNGQDYVLYLVLRGTGCLFFVKPPSGDVYLRWPTVLASGGGGSATQANMKVKASFNANQVTFDNVRITQLPAPFTSDYGIAIYDTQTFTQSLGAELLTNPSFAAWTADNPDGWTVEGEVASDPMITEVASGGGAGTGAARFYSSATNFAPNITQSGILVSGSWYELAFVVSAIVAGTVYYEAQGSLSNIIAVVDTVRVIGRSGGTGLTLYTWTGGADFTLDSVSIKKVTLNAEVATIADGIFDFSFTLPVDPAPRERVELWYRANGDQNYWTAYLKYNDAGTAWDFRLDSVSAGTATNRINVTGVGTPDMIRVIVDGDLHDCYTKATTIWTKRGTQVNNATHNTNTGVRTIYASTVTPGRLTVYPRTSSQYNILELV